MTMRDARYGDDAGGGQRRGSITDGSIPAMLGGARMKILQVSTDKPSQYLVVSPKITNIKQLNGKTVAISDAAAIRPCCFASS